MTIREGDPVMNSLGLGLNTLVQNTVYAVPGRRVIIHSNAVLEGSNDSTTGFVSLLTTTTGAEVAAAFVRCTTAAAVVNVKA